MVDCLLALRGDYGNHRVATSLHGCGGTDILFTEIVRDHGDRHDRASVVGTSFALDYRAGLGVADRDSFHRVLGNCSGIHGDHDRGTGTDSAGL